MKKSIIILFVLVMLLSTACSRNTEKFELVLITDLGSIDDKSFNQGSWEGLSQYAIENNITRKSYKPAEQSESSYLMTIDLAIRGGAKVIVTTGYLFAGAVFIAQDRYPDTRFILVDALPGNDEIIRISENTVAILYAEDQAGFLAGYAAVIDGYRRLGFIGGMAVPAVVRFGYGFVQGAEYAARELGLTPGSVTINYNYTGGFSATPEVKSLAASWYNSGVEVIFGCGGALGNSVMAAADETGSVMIGVDVDQSVESSSVITSAMKKLHYSVYTSIAAAYEDRFSGGQAKVFDAANEGVGLPMETSKFRNFSQIHYDTIYQKLANNEIPRVTSTAMDGSPIGTVPVDIVRIVEIR